MTTSEQIAQVVREVSGDMAKHIREARSGAEQEIAVDVVASLRILAKMITDMSLEDAKAVIMDFENPERGRIVDALASKGIFF